MNFTGRLTNVSKDWLTGETVVSFTVNEPSALYEIDKIKDAERLTVEAKRYRKKRSLDANAMLWACLGEIAAAIEDDKWKVYLRMLKRYGKYTYMIVKPNAAEAVQQEWRCSEIIGDIEVNGQPAVQMLCYFGSSTYNSKEFSVLLDGVIDEMKHIGLQPPLSDDVKAALEAWNEAAEKRVH